MTIGILNGKIFDYLDPDPELIDIETMATVLGRVPRFGGHTTRVITVAEHSLRVQRFVGAIVEDHMMTTSALPRLELDALLHDGHEAYTPWGDMTDGKTDWHRDVERGIDAAIYEALGLELPGEIERRIVKRADGLALFWEGALWAPHYQRWTDARVPTEQEFRVTGPLALPGGAWEDWDWQYQAMLLLDRIRG